MEITPDSGRKLIKNCMFSPSIGGFFQKMMYLCSKKQNYMLNSIIGRKEEIALLEKYMSSNHSEFIAI